jgi:CRISPR-associated protein Csm5
MRYEIMIETPTLISDKDHISSFEIYQNNKNNTCRIIDTENFNVDKDELNKIIKLIKETLGDANNFNKRDTYTKKFEQLQKEYEKIASKRNIFYNNVIFNRIHNSNLKNEIKLPIHSKIYDNGMKMIPYIPGSSLKGAIRNAVLKSYVKKIQEFPDYVNMCINSRNKNRNYGQCLNILFDYREEEIKKDKKDKYDPLYDIFSFLEVSDFNPKPSNPEEFELSLRQMRRVYKNESYKNEGKKPKGLPVQAIMIEKGTFIGDIRINIPKSTEKKKQIMEKFNEMLGCNCDDENTILSNIIDKLKETESVNNGGKIIFYMGFGKGAERNTIISVYPKFIDKYTNTLHGKRKWPPSTFYILENSNNNLIPGRVSIMKGENEHTD